jgi:signal transduction histidine kinase
MQKSGVVVPEEQHLILSRLPPSRTQKRLALALVLGSLAAFLIIALPLAGTDEPYLIAGFVPGYFTANFVVELITAILLFAQFSTLRTRATLVIASGYLYAAFLLILLGATLPNVFVPNKTIGGPQSAVWAFFFSRAGFALFVIGYALLKDADPAKRFYQGTAGAAIALSVAATAVLASVVAYVCIGGESLLPKVMLDPFTYGPLRPLVAVPIGVFSLLAIILLWRRLSSALDLWLMVVMWLIAIQILNYYFDQVRYGISWYTVRMIGFVGNSLVLIVLLYEIETLYARLLGAVLAQRHEREVRLMTGDTVAAAIAHEVKQPLTAMITSADASFRFLDRPAPNLDKAKEALKRVVADGHRAGAMVDGIRANFKKDDLTTTSLDVNELIRHALALEHADLQRHRIVVKAEPNPQLPEVRGNQVQLQQVLLNLITNAIDAMAAKDEPRVLLVKSETHEDAGVVISVADTGPGINSQDIDRIFNPLFTTKSHGMGMGLSICRAIIEAHHGRLWVTPNTPCGVVFQFTLLADNAVAAGA